ncbi:MAG: hypothetical protein AABY32_02090 [Nanoarchaeota archaeon]
MKKYFVTVNCREEISGNINYTTRHTPFSFIIEEDDYKGYCEAILGNDTVRTSGTITNLIKEVCSQSGVIMTSYVMFDLPPGFEHFRDGS